MQQTWRLKFKRDVVLLWDKETFDKQERESDHLFSVKQMKENVREQIVVKHDVAQTQFEKYLNYVNNNTTVFTCHHHKFYWHLCVKCHRDKKQAQAYQVYYRNKINKLLN